MKVFRNLKLIGAASQQTRLIDLIEQQLSNGWVRDRKREAELKSQHGYDYTIFTCSKTASRPAAELSLITDKNGYLYVSNIVPKELGETSEDQYNAILEEFLNQFVEYAANELDIQIITTPDERSIDNAMSPEMSQLLKQFSAANKTSGGTHPLDKRRFLNFIVQAHNERSLLDEIELIELLLDEGWSNSHAQNLSSKYSFGRDLLKCYSNQE
ncbi:MAG: hypothetical protein ACK400_17490 [Pseudanabaena sp.]